MRRVWWVIVLSVWASAAAAEPVSVLVDAPGKLLSRLNAELRSMGYAPEPRLHAESAVDAVARTGALAALWTDDDGSHVFVFDAARAQTFEETLTGTDETRASHAAELLRARLLPSADTLSRAESAPRGDPPVPPESAGASPDASPISPRTPPTARKWLTLAAGLGALIVPARVAPLLAFASTLGVYLTPKLRVELSALDQLKSREHRADTSKLSYRVDLLGAGLRGDVFTHGRFSTSVAVGASLALFSIERTYSEPVMGSFRGRRAFLSGYVRAALGVDLTPWLKVQLELGVGGQARPVRIPFQDGHVERFGQPWLSAALGLEGAYSR